VSDLGSFVKRLRDIMRNDAGINGDAQRIEQIAWLLFLKVYDAQEEDWAFDDEDYMSIIPEDCRWQNWAVDDGKGTAMTGDALLNFVNNRLFPALKGLEIDADTEIKKAIVKSTFEDANQYMKDGVLLRQVVNVIDEVDFGDYEESHAFGDIYESILKELQSAGSAGEFYTPRAVTDFMAERIKPKIGETMADFACGTGGFIVSWLKQLAPQVRTTADEMAVNRSIYGIEKKQFPYMLCVTNMLLHGVEVPRIDHGNALLKDVLDYTEKDQFDVILMNPPYGGSEKASVKHHFPEDLASSETADLFMSVIMYRLKPDGRAAVILPDGFLFGTDNTKAAIKKKLLTEFNLHTVVRMPGSVFSPYTSITTNILFFDRTGPTKKTWFYRLDMPEGYKHFSKTKPMKSEHFDPVRAWWDDRQVIEDEDTETFKSQCYTAAEIAENGYNLDLCGYPHEEEEILPPLELIHEYQEKRASLNAEIDRVLEEIVAKLPHEGDQDE
jgi:type I restriction enzyme M protein